MTEYNAVDEMVAGAMEIYQNGGLIDSGCFRSFMREILGAVVGASGQEAAVAEIERIIDEWRDLA